MYYIIYLLIPCRVKCLRDFDLFKSDFFQNGVKNRHNEESVAPKVVLI